MEKNKIYKFIASIKIGSSCSGYAYSFFEDFNENQLKIGTYTWEVHDRYTSQKTASSILFRPDGTFDSFGYESEKKYAEPKHGRDKWFYFPRFPQKTTKLREDSEFTEVHGKRMSALTVYASAIRALKDHLMSKIQNRLYNLPESDILWTIVDADQSNETFYKKAAIEAGITWQVVVIPKASASIAYYKCACRNRGTHFSPTSTYMIVDASAEHLDLSVLSKSGRKELTNKRKYLSVGDSFNSAIEKLFEPLRTLMNTSQATEFTAEISAHIEFLKRKIKPNVTKPLRLFLPKINIDEQKFKDAFLETQYADKIWVQSGQIHIAHDVIMRVFVDAAEHIVEELRKILDNDDMKAIKVSHDIVMIGGCSESLFLQNAMKKAFPDSTLYIPVEPAMIDVKGAAIFGHLKDTISQKGKLATMSSIIETLKGKKQRTRNMRVIVIGEERVGKTTLCKRLMKEHVVMEEITSTEGIDIFIQRFVVDLDTKEIVKLAKGTETDNALKRLICLLNSKMDEKQSATSSGKPSSEGRQDLRNSFTRQNSVVVCPPMKQRKHSVTKQKSTDENGSDEEKSNIGTTIYRRRTPSSSTSPKHITRQEEIFEESHHQFVEKVERMISEEEEINDREAFLSLWDCGGQESFYNTHHIFFSSDAIYLIAYNIKECLGKDKKHALERVKYWIRSIGTYADDENLKRLGTPPVLLVGTHLDKIAGTEEEIQEQIDEVHNALCDDEDLQYIRAQSQGIYNVDNTTEDHSCFTVLWQAIVDSAKYQAQWEQELPAKWLSLEKNLMQKKSEGVKIMTLEEVKELDKIGMVPINNDHEIKLFLRNMNFTGCILYFGEEDCSKGQNLKDTVILNPQWLSDAFRQIITSPQFSGRQNRNPKLDMRWRMYRKTAELDEDFLEMVWNQDKSEEFFRYKDILLSFMDRLGLIAKPKSSKPIQSFLVPSMLKETSAEDLSSDLCHRHTLKTRTLCLVFQDRFIPSPIFDKLIAACIEKYEVLKKENKRLLRRGFGVFMVDSSWNLVVNCNHHMVKLTMYTRAPISTHVEPGIGLKVRLFIEDALKQLIDLYKHRHLEYDYHIDCKFIMGTHSQTILKSDIEAQGAMSCCDGEHFLKRKDLREWFYEDQKDEGEGEDNADCCLSSEVLDRPPTEKELAKLSHDVVDGYQLLFAELGLGMNRIMEIETDHKDKKTAVKIYHMFLFWRNTEGQKGTTRVIVDAMKRHDMGVSDLEKIFGRE